ncbi:MAG: SusC/RagA family TonB-linked outer membrane protein [Bacteroidaceae bacterium]|nr:SusC/RagA family TonB-linked outer membrane protein [Bacteroidaceae bacterium]
MTDFSGRWVRRILMGCLWVAMPGVSGMLYAQSTSPGYKINLPVNTIRGRVLDEQGEPLPSAKITIRMKDGKESHAVADMDGNFTFAATGNEERLYASYVGFKEDQLYIKKDKKEYVFKLKEDGKLMDDVVVTGYNTIDKRKLTSAITTVTQDDLDLKGALTVDQMLEGKVAGLMVMNTSATPGAAPKMRLRGTSTFTGSREPLWVIDGIIYENPVPLSADDINSLDNINLIGNAISGLNPQDIARIDVLKDASATAIYGTRAANGVIVVTTKTGEAGKVSVNYSYNAQFQQRPHYSDFNLMTSKQRIDVSREIMQRGLYFQTMPERYGYEGAMMDYWDKKISFDQFQSQVSTMEQNNTDWFGQLYRNSLSQTHNASLSGGTSSTRYYTSIGYTKDNGAERGTELQRLTARMNLSSHLSNRLTIDLRLSGSFQDAGYNNPYYSAFDEAYYTNRIFPARHADGSYAYIQKLITEDQTTQKKVYGRYNILDELDNSGQTVKNTSLNLTGNINWEIFDGLRYTTTLGLTTTSNSTESTVGEQTFYCATLRGYDYGAQPPRADANEQSRLLDGGVWMGSHTAQLAYTWRNQLNYNFDIQNVHYFNFDLGQEMSSTYYRGQNSGLIPGYMPSQGETFVNYWAGSPDDARQYYWYLRQWFMGSGDVKATSFPTITDKRNNTLSFYLTATYSLQNLFSLNFNIRNDGSNQFGQYESAKFNPVWSISGRTNLQEYLLRDVEWIDAIALRASYGYRGSVPSATPYLIIGTPKTNSTTGELSAPIKEYPNANLKWEKTSTWNGGLEVALLRNRINLGVDFYYSRSTDLITNRSVSLINGTTSLYYNNGIATNTGIEFSLNTLNVKTSDLAWRTSFIFSYNKNRVEQGIVGDNMYGDYIGGSAVLDGTSVDGFYSYQFAGLDEYGLPRFHNLTNLPDGLSRDQVLQTVLTYSGTRTPHCTGSFSTDLRWKNLMLRAQFTYKLGYKQRLLALYQGGNPSLPQPENNLNATFVDRWRQPGDEAHTDIPGLTNVSLNMPTGTETITASNQYQYTMVDYRYLRDVGPTTYAGWYMYDNSDARVVSCDHIRFQSLTLGYELPKKWLTPIHVADCRIDFQAQNLAFWTFDKKLKGQDPDQVASIGLPVLPSFNVGVQLSF